MVSPVASPAGAIGGLTGLESWFWEGLAVYYETKLQKGTGRLASLLWNGTFAAGVADGLGYGNYSKLRGDATTRWLLLANGFAHVSVHDLLGQADAKTIEDQVKELVKDPGKMGIADGQVLHDKELVSAVETIVASVKAKGTD